jgi:hypothetical protein
MKKRIARWIKIVSITVVLTLPPLLVLRLYAPSNPQVERREKAKPYLPVVEEVLAKDSRFANVKAEINYNGAILLTGKVRSDQEYWDLKDAVKAKSLPLMVLWSIDSSGEPPVQGAK